MNFVKRLLLLLFFGVASVMPHAPVRAQDSARAAGAVRDAKPSSSSTGTDTTPPGMVAFFMTELCPQGWVIPKDTPGRLIVGVTDGGVVGKTVNTPLKNMEAPTHQHTYKTTVKLGSKKIALTNGSNRQGARHGNYSVSGTTELNGTDDAKHVLPFINLTVCQKQ